MRSEFISFTLNDGTTMIVPAPDWRRIYERLWDLSPEPGAVSTAALLLEASRLRLRRPVELTSAQSEVLRRAVDGLAEHH